MSSDFRVNPAHHSALPTNTPGRIPNRPSPNGLSSTSSSLAPSIRQQAHEGFFQNWCDDCCGMLKRLVQRLFPWLFPNQSQEVVIPQGPISAAVMDQRVMKAQNYLEQQLRTRVADPRNLDAEWEPHGIDNELIQNSKVIVFLEYNGTKDFCFSQMNGPPSLEALKNLASRRLKILIRHPDNREAHVAELSITTHAYSAPGMYRRTIPCYSLNKQNRRVTLNPDNTLSERANGCGGCDSYFTRDTLDNFREFAQEHVSTPQWRQQLEQFLFQDPNS